MEKKFSFSAKRRRRRRIKKKTKNEGATTSLFVFFDTKGATSNKGKIRTRHNPIKLTKYIICNITVLS